jgi:hypothetical protein
MTDERRGDNQQHPDELVQDDTKESKTEPTAQTQEEIKEEVEDDDRFQATDNWCNCWWPHVEVLALPKALLKARDALSVAADGARRPVSEIQSGVYDVGKQVCTEHRSDAKLLTCDSL